MKLSPEEKERRAKVRAEAREKERRAVEVARAKARAKRLKATGYENEYATPAGMKPKGWTAAMIQQLLGEPDNFGVNPHYKSGPPTRLYLTSRVSAVEKSKEFRDWVKQHRNVREGAQKAIETKRGKLLAYVDQITITVPLIEHVQSLAIDSYNAWNWDRDKYASENDSPEFLDRITVNYIRHEMTDYEKHLRALFGKVEIASGLHALRERIFQKIGEVYPDLEEECDRQLYPPDEGLGRVRL